MAKPTRFTQELIDEYVAKGYWTKETTTGLWDRNAGLYPNKEALVDSRNRLTWSQVKRLTDRIGLGFLRLGYKKDDIVCLLLPNCADSFVARLALDKAGIICMTALMTIREHEIEYTLKNYDVRGVIIPKQFRKFNYYQAISDMKPKLPALKDIFVIGEDVPPGTHAIEQMAKQPADSQYPEEMLQKTRFQAFDVATIGLTSGTTGIPKAVEHPICTRLPLGTNYQSMPKLRSEDVVLNVINAIAGLGSPFSYSVPRLAPKTVLLEVWNAEEAFRLIQKERGTVVLTAPAQLAMMLRDPSASKYDLSSWRCVCCSTSPLPHEVAVEAEEKFKIIVTNAYGTLDGGGIARTTVDDAPETRYCTVGKPLVGNEIKLLDDKGKEVPLGEQGEVCFRGPSTTSGHFRDMQRTLEAWGTLGKEGFFRTGDLGKIDKTGNVVLTGRIKDIIIRGGQNIYPAEIEGLLTGNPRVDQAAVVAMPDPIMGEKACAFVVPKKGASFTFQEMTAFLQGKKIAPYKVPEKLEIINELPLRNFKVDKAALRDIIAKKLKAESKA